MSTQVVGGHVGPVFVADGIESQSFRQEQHGALVAQQAGGKYREAVKRGNCYAAMTAVTGVAPGTALGTTAAYCLHNPSGSLKRLIIHKISMAYVSGTLGAGIVSICSSSVGDAVPTGTAITPRNLDAGNSNSSVALPFTTATITTNAAKMIEVFCQTTAADGTGTTFPSSVEKDIDGGIIVEPGYNITLHGTTAAGSTPRVVFCVTWEEETIAA